MRILVCGGRGYKDREKLFLALDRLNPKIVIHGACRSGADKLAKKWTQSRGKIEVPFAAKWRKYGHAAGPIRNKRMLEEGDPDLVVSFPGGRGTANMMKLTGAAGTPYVVIE